MVNHKYVPERGDIIWLNFPLSKGHEQSGRRPAIILSPWEYNHLTELAIVCPVTSKAKGYNFEVPVQISGKESVVLSDQIKSIDWKNRNPDFITKSEQPVIGEVLENIRALLYN